MKGIAGKIATGLIALLVLVTFVRVAIIVRRFLRSDDGGSLTAPSFVADTASADTARTFVVPDDSRPDVVAARLELSRVTEGSMWAGIAAMASARNLGDIGAAIQDYIEAQGEYGILREYVGHGIGRKMHEAPSVFNYRVPDRGPEVRPGLVLAIEPMVVTGDQATFVEDDDWTVSTLDGGAGSHWEHSVAVHDDGIWVLTAPDGGAAGLAAFGVTPREIP